MKNILLTLGISMLATLHGFAEVTIDEASFGKSLGGWNKRGSSVAEYPLSGADYRTYKPEISPTPDGGIFISVRIDHMRGWLASDDHAVLEITVNPKGAIASAQSSIAIQGQSIKSDVILGGNEAGKTILSPEGAVQIGTDLVANLSAKLMRENIVEAGRVSFPSALRHNYNHLFQAIRVDGVQVLPAPPVATAVVTPLAPVPSAAPATAPATNPVVPDKPKEDPAKGSVPLEIKPFN